ncbi:MAG: hypothetical protein FJ082_15245 [Cyanobacteria bacterium K_Offshore_surface_m2_011]|nr:hypothetical protein [Cyanobacteria bacterium K_Offshore_surface_m2_011]
MNDLLGQMVGWLPMLGRPQVLLQLALVAVAVVVSRLVGRRCGPGGRSRWLELAATGVVGVLGWGLLTIARQPTALAVLLITLVAGLQVSELVLHRAERWLPEDQIQPLRHLLIRPFLLAGLLWTLIEQLDTRAELALIPLGR